MPLWKYKKKDIEEVLTRIFQDRWKSYTQPSGLYIWVELNDGKYVTVTSSEITSTITEIHNEKR